MDPDSNLAEQLALAQKLIIEDMNESDVVRLCDLVLALDGWIVRKGFLPKRWKE